MKKIPTLLSIIATIACAAAAEAAPEAAAAAPFSFALSGTVDPSVSYYSRNDGSAFLNPAGNEAGGVTGGVNSSTGSISPVQPTNV